VTTDPPAARLPLVATPADALGRSIFDALAAGAGILNLHRTMAHAPALLKVSGDMAQAFRRDTMLPRALTELIVLRTAQVLECSYIWRRHLGLAHDAGVTESQIGELSAWPGSAAFTPAQKAALAFAEAAARAKPVSDAAFADLSRDFSPREIVEMTMLVGFYVSTAILIAALAVPGEPA